MSKTTTTTKATADYKVSLPTAKYIQCLNKCSELYSSILDAIVEQYGDPSEGYNSEKLMWQDFCPAIDQLREKLYKYIGQSIEEQQAALENNNTII